MTFTAWQIVFGLAASVYFVGNLIYVITIQGHPQKWNFSDPSLNSRSPGVTEEKMHLAPKAEHEDTDKIWIFISYIKQLDGLLSLGAQM